MKTLTKNNNGVIHTHLPARAEDGSEMQLEVWITTKDPYDQPARLSSISLHDEDLDAIASAGDMSVRDAAAFLGTGVGTIGKWLKKPDPDGRYKLDAVPGVSPTVITGESIEQVWRGSPNRVLQKDNPFGSYYRAESITVRELHERWRQQITKGITAGIPELFVMQETIKQVMTEMQAVLPHIKQEKLRDRLFDVKRRLRELVAA